MDGTHISYTMELPDRSVTPEENSIFQPVDYRQSQMKERLRPEVNIKVKSDRSKLFSGVPKNSNINELSQNGCNSISFGKVDYFLGRRKNRSIYNPYKNNYFGESDY